MNDLTVLKQALDGLPFGVTLWEAESKHPEDLRLVYANARASNEAGVELKELVGSLAEGFLSASLAQALPKPEGGGPSIVRDEVVTIPRYVYKDNNGQTREYRVHLVPVWERTVALTYEVLGKDEARALEPPHQLRDYFEDIVRTLHEPLVVLDGDLSVMWANHVFAKTFAVAESAEGRAFVDLVAGEGVGAKLAERLLRVLPEDAPVQGEEFELVSGDGTVRICVMNARRLDSRDGTAELLLVAIEEVTELRRREELQRSFVESLVHALDDERRAIARDLHDRIGQALTSHTVMLQQLEKTADVDRVRDGARQLHAGVEELLDDIGNLVARLHPYRLEQLGLAAALRQQVEEFAELHALEVDFEATGWDRAAERADPSVEIGLYRIVQEALTNVARHARARSVSVTLHRDDDAIRLVVEDDGCGFDPDSVAPKGRGLGLVSLYERARLMGGALTIESSEERGTTVVVSIPLQSRLSAE